MRSGPKALVFRGGLFRISELAWVKVAPLTRYQLGVKIALFVFGAIFMWAVVDAKGSWKNLESLLGLLAMHVAYYLRGDVRIASTGDLEDTYEDRTGGDRDTFVTWVKALGESDNDVKIGRPEGEYFYWINLTRVAWVRPRPQVDFYGLLLIPVFLGYEWVMRQGFKIPLNEILEDWNFLTFSQSTGFVSLMCWLVALGGLAATLVSIRNAVEVRASGGLTDTLPMSGRDQALLFEALSGNREAVASEAVSQTPAT